MCIRRAFFYVVGKFVPFRFTTVKVSKKKKKEEIIKNKLGDGKKFGYEYING